MMLNGSNLTAQLRTYPPKFGMKMTSLHQRFLDELEPPPPLPERVQLESCRDLFQQLPFDDLWWDADMPLVVKYLRGNNSLNLESWRELFPQYL